MSISQTHRVRHLLEGLLFIVSLRYLSPAFADPTCLIAAVGPIIIYDPVDSNPKSGSGSVSVTCTYLGLGSTPVAYQIQLSTGVSNSYAARNMRFLVVNSLNYNMFTDPGNSIIWGNGLSGSSALGDSYSMTAGVIIKSYPIYTQIPARQAVVAGVYLDAINLTLMY